MAKVRLPRTKMNYFFHKAVKRLKVMTPAERVRLLIESGALPADQEAVAVARLTEADARAAAAAAPKP